MSEPEKWEFNFTVPRPPEREVVALTSVEQERLLLQQFEAAKDDPTQAMWTLAQFYKNNGKLSRAVEIFRDLLDRVPDLESKAQLVFSLGQTAEKSRDYELAVRFYREALAIEPCSTFTWYFIHNNLGYSLNQLGRYSQGEIYCRRAIEISAKPPNAYKNLGLALAGQGRYREAAEAFIAATQANASDPRALRHLEALLTEHPELEFDFAKHLEACRAAVAAAEEAATKAEAEWRAAANRQKS